MVARKKSAVRRLIMLFILVLGWSFVAYYALAELKQKPPVTAEAGKKQVVEKQEEVNKPLPEIIISNTEILPGGYFSVFVKNADERDLIEVDTDLMQEKPVFYNYKGGKLAILGFNSRVKSGTHSFSIKAVRDGIMAAEKKVELTVTPKEFEKQYLTVSKTQKEQRSDEKLNDDSVYTSKAKSQTADTPLWQGAFIKPVEGKITTEYAMTRYINNEESGRHGGLDIAAPRGTPVKASNDGVVKLSMMLNVSGNTVIIDHGCNLFTSYVHMDKLLVKEGETVKKGDVIGAVGSTGFSTGPHLHWTTTVGATFMDPNSLIDKNPLDFLEDVLTE